jgi:hypothetical protein
METIKRSHEWEDAFEDAKTKKAVLFIMIQEIVTSTPNDQELGARIRKIINNYKLNTNTNR